MKCSFSRPRRTVAFTRIRRLQQIQVLRNALPRHIQVFAKLIERAPVVRLQQIEATAADWNPPAPEQKDRY